MVDCNTWQSGFKVVREYDGRYFSLMDHPAITHEYRENITTAASRKLGPLFVFATYEDAQNLATCRSEYKVFECSYLPSPFAIPAMCATPDDGGAVRHFWKLYRMAKDRGIRAGAYNNLFLLHEVLPGTVFAQRVTLTHLASAKRPRGRVVRHEVPEKVLPIVDQIAQLEALLNATKRAWW